MSGRILVVATRFPWASETFIGRKVRALRAAGLDVTVAAPWLYPQDPSVEAVPVLQLPQLKVPRTWGTAARAVVRNPSARRIAPRLARAPERPMGLLPIVAGRFDLVHFEFSGLAVSVVDELTDLAPAKLAVSCRGGAERVTPHTDPTRRDRLGRMFEQMALIHCVSDDMAATVRALGAPAERILVNRPAVDTERWAGIGRVDDAARGTADAPLRVLSVGRLHWAKGFDDAIRAVAAARDRGVHVHLRIAGEGPEREKLQYLRHSLDVEGAVELLGWQSQDDVEAQLGWADAFLLSSLTEGISNAALEALAAGIPLVSTRCGGMAEVVIDPTQGTLVEVGDVDAMADALGALGDPSGRRALALGGTARAREAFDLQRQADVFADAYRALLAT